MSKIKKTTLYVNGMHCPSCDVLINDKFREEGNVVDVKPDFKKQKVEVFYTGQLNKKKINEKIKKFGYEIVEGKTIEIEKEPLLKRVGEALGIGLVILMLYLIVKELGLIPSFNFTGNLSLLTIFVIGLVASTSTCMATSGALFLSLVKPITLYQSFDRLRMTGSDIKLRMTGSDIKLMMTSGDALRQAQDDKRENQVQGATLRQAQGDTVKVQAQGDRGERQFQSDRGEVQPQSYMGKDQLQGDKKENQHKSDIGINQTNVKKNVMVSQTNHVMGSQLKSNTSVMESQSESNTSVMVSQTKSNTSVMVSQTNHDNLRKAIFFNTGRIFSYGFFGFLAGLVGKALIINLNFGSFLTLLAGIFMILLGLDMAKILSLGAIIPSGLNKVIFENLEHKLMKYPHKAPFFLGALTYILPCGFTQAVQVYALGLASPVQSAITMMVFAIGTTPALILVGGLTRLTKLEGYKYFMKTMGVLVLMIGLSYAANFLSLYGINLFGVSNSSSTVNSSIKDGVQTINMKVVASGYIPNQFVIKKGVPVRWIIQGENVFGCQAYFIVPKLGIQRTFEPGENIIEFTPKETGFINFSCGMGMYRGRIEVVD